MILNVDGNKITLTESDSIFTSNSFKDFIAIKKIHEHKYSIVTDAFNVKLSSFVSLVDAAREALEISSNFK